ncbi:MAG: DNA replication and repair protein RecF [Bacteroidetes bacterium]|nr:DNA replication and repair protein RecF [Bacteroidota bacterium]MCY4206268.1 DNA replication and repair protein RecF [Bacteroidota bacterium]
MVLRSVRLRNIRAHADSVLTFAPGINLLYGSNGAGKTNILEAVHYLCLSKSFLTSVERYVLRRSTPFFEIEGEFEGTLRRELTIRIAFAPREGKRIFINGAPLDRLADIVGVVPVVVFAPGDQSLTFGGPEERRKFLNSMLSQARPAHLEDLMRYRRAVRQRNEYLVKNRGRQIDESLIAPLNAILARFGGRIIALRSAFLKTFGQELKHAWERLGEAIEKPAIQYQTPIQEKEQASAKEAESALLSALASSTRRDVELGRTTVGPHRDELIFKLDDQEVRRFASTGQHRSFAIALKLAQYQYLDSRLEEKPILLLDDVFDSLDPDRTEVILEWLRDESTGQSLLTAADAERLRSRVAQWGTANRCIQIDQGGITENPAEE